MKFKVNDSKLMCEVNEHFWNLHVHKKYFQRHEEQLVLERQQSKSVASSVCAVEIYTNAICQRHDRFDRLLCSTYDQIHNKRKQQKTQKIFHCTVVKAPNNLLRVASFGRKKNIKEIFLPTNWQKISNPYFNPCLNVYTQLIQSAPTPLYYKSIKCSMQKL